MLERKSASKSIMNAWKCAKPQLDYVQAPEASKPTAIAEGTVISSNQWRR